VHGLLETQVRVMNALLGRDDGAAAVVLLRPGGLPPPLRRMQIYRNNVFETALTALSAVFPVVARLVGRDFFRTAGAAYARVHPSRSGDLHRFGEYFADFLGDYLPAAGLPYLGDVAALEWAYHVAYRKIELAALEPRRLAQIPVSDQPRLRLHLQPSASLIGSPFPILKIWQANQPGQIDDAATISLELGGVDVLVVQSDREIEFRLLTPGERRWLSNLAGGDCLADASAAALDCDPAFDLAAALVRHMSLGLFVAVSVS